MLPMPTGDSIRGEGSGKFQVVLLIISLERLLSSEQLRSQCFEDVLFLKGRGCLFSFDGLVAMLGGVTHCRGQDEQGGEEALAG